MLLADAMVVLWSVMVCHALLPLSALMAFPSHMLPFQPSSLRAVMTAGARSFVLLDRNLLMLLPACCYTHNTLLIDTWMLSS